MHSVRTPSMVNSYQALYPIGLTRSISSFLLVIKLAKRNVKVENE